MLTIYLDRVENIPYSCFILEQVKKHYRDSITIINSSVPLFYQRSRGIFMCSKILKTKSFAKTLPLYKFLAVVSFLFIGSAQNFKTFGAEEINAGEGAGIKIVSAQRQRLNLPEIDVSDELLAKVDTKTAQEKLDRIYHYVAYMVDVDYWDDIIDEVKSFSGNARQDPEGFQKYLKDRAWEVFEEGSMTSYLKTLAGKIRKLQGIVSQFQEQEAILRNTVESCRTDIMEIEEKIRTIEEKEETINTQDTEIKKLNAEIHKLKGQNRLQLNTEDHEFNAETHELNAEIYEPKRFMYFLAGSAVGVVGTIAIGGASLFWWNKSSKR